VGVAAAAQERGGGFFGLGQGVAPGRGFALRLRRRRGGEAQMGVREVEGAESAAPAAAAAMGVGQLG